MLKMPFFSLSVVNTSLPKACCEEIHKVKVMLFVCYLKIGIMIIYKGEFTVITLWNKSFFSDNAS